MKLLLTITLALIVNISFGQELNLFHADSAHKYNVKQVTDYDYTAEKNTDKIDTTDKPVITLHKFKNNKEDTALMYDKSGNIKLLYTYKYNDLGQLIETDFFDEGTKLTQKFVFEYDDKGNRTVFDGYYYHGITTEYKTVYIYDANNRKTEEDIAGDGYTTKKSFKYTDTGIETEQDMYFNDTLRGRDLYTYNEFGSLLTVDSYSTDDKLQTKTVYTYSNIDKNNNWQIRTYRFENSWKVGDYLIYKITKRKIIYGL